MSKIVLALLLLFVGCRQKETLWQDTPGQITGKPSKNMDDCDKRCDEMNLRSCECAD